MWAICALMCIVICIASAQPVPEMFHGIDKEPMNRWVDSVFITMDTDERIGQLFMPIVHPKEDKRNVRTMLHFVKEAKVGGVLFQKGDAMTQAKVTNRLQHEARVPLLVSLDGEWGLSMRLEGTPRFPKNMMLGAIEDTALLAAYGREVGRQCRQMGIHINFAPVMDVNSNMENPVIGIRSFGENPEAVAEKGIAYAKGLEAMGILSVAKHFPGHGDTSEDSHQTLPAVWSDTQRLDSVELLPFRRYIDAGLGGIMTGHLFVPALDPTRNLPSSLSRPIVTGLLQRQLNFRGLCFTDAMEMKGAASPKENPSVLSLLAGNDILLAPTSLADDLSAVKAAVRNGTIPMELIEEKCRKVLRYKYLLGLNSYQPIDTAGLSERLNTPHSAWLVSKLNAEAITLLKNDSDCLPLQGVGRKKFAVLSLGSPVGNTFQSFLNRYDTVSCFSLPIDATASQVQSVYRQLEAYDVILCSIHSVRIPETQSLRQLATQRTVALIFFTHPYFCRFYNAIGSAAATVMAYENTPFAQEYAAQLIFGGIPAKGKLPVTIPDLFPAGTGISAAKTRLGYQEPQEVGLDPLRLQVIDKLAEEGLANDAYPGCQILVAKNGMIVYHRTFGYHDEHKTRRVTEASVYDLASITKVAATLPALMVQYDENRFTLNDKISVHLPELLNSNKKNIIIRDMLYHQSGLPSVINYHLKTIDETSYKGSLFSAQKSSIHPLRFDAKTYARNDFTFLPALVSPSREAEYNTEVARNFYIHDSFQDTIMQEIKSAPLVRRGRMTYSCINFILLKMVVERQTGEPMHVWLHEHYYNRLGARSTTYLPLQGMDAARIVPTENDRFLRRQVLLGYVHDEMAAFQGGVSGNAGLFSNAEDLAKLLQLYLNEGAYGGERFFSVETARLFTQSKSPNSRRGLGFDKPSPAGHSSPCSMLAHPSTYGHTGYTGTCFWIDPHSQLLYIFLSNHVNPTRANTKLHTLDIRKRIQDAIYKSMIRN